MGPWNILTGALCGVISLISNNSSVCPFQSTQSVTKHYNQVKIQPIIQETNSYLPLAVQIVNNIVDQTLNSELKQIIYDSFITKELIDQQRQQEEEKEEEKEEEEDRLSTTPAEDSTEDVPSETSTDTAGLETSSPELKAPSPELKTPSPELKTPSPELKTPSPELKTPSPELKTPSPELETPSPRQTPAESTGNGNATHSEPDNLRILRSQYEAHLKRIMVSELFDHPESGASIGEEFLFPGDSGTGKVLSPEMDSLPGARDDPNYWQPDVNRLLDSIKVAEVFRQISPDLLVMAELRDHLISEAIHKRLRSTTGLSSGVISFLYQIDNPDARQQTLVILKKILETKDVSEQKTVDLTNKIVGLLESPTSKLSKSLEKCIPVRYSA